LLDGAEENLSSANNDLGRAMKYYRDSRDSSGVLETFEGLGRVYEEKGNKEKALSYYLRALSLYERHKEKPEAYFVLLENIGHLYLKKGDEKMALRYLQEGINDSIREERRDTEVNLLDEEGEVYQQEGQRLRALETYKEVLTEAKKYKQPEEQARALINIADVLKKQDAAASLKDLKAALSIARRLNQPQLKERIYGALAGVYRQEKNYKEAMTALQEQHRLLDSLLDANTVKDIAVLDSSYALERSFERIGRLQKVNRQEKGAIQAAVMIIMTIVLIAILLWFYLRKMKRLNKELEASNRVKDTLFSVIGHDLKGPAGSAVQLFELMETEQFNEEEMRGMIADLRKQMTASLELLNALFEWGKAQLQGVKVNASQFNVNPVVNRCISLLEQQAAQKNIDIIGRIPDNLLVQADADHVELVIRNLVANAIKFSHEGSRIDVDAKESTDHEEVVVAVRDHGVGISKSQQEVFRSGNLKVSFGTRKEKGSGLGLMLVKDFVKANQGRIWLESEEGVGTTFYVALPAA
jgi:signal transduction histidine kinase